MGNQISWSKIFFFSLVAWVGHSEWQKHEFAHRSLASASRVPVTLASSGEANDPCDSKEYCVVAYISPWCSSCQQSVPFVKAVREHLKGSSRVGMKLVVGHDKPDQIKKMAEAIGGEVYMDTDSRMYKALGLDSVPRWIVWDKNKQIVAEMKGSPVSPANEQTAAIFSKQFLKLP